MVIFSAGDYHKKVLPASQLDIEEDIGAHYTREELISNGFCTPALRHDQVPKKESSKPSMNLRPQVHPHTRNSWQNLWRLRKKWFFFTFDQKMGQKVLKMGFKCLGLVWYVLVWLDCDQNWSELKNRIQTAFYSKFQSSFQTPGN